MEVIVWFLLRAATMTDNIATSVVSFDTLPLEALTGCITFVHIFWICCVGGGRDIAFQPLRAISFDDDYSDGSRYQDTQDRRSDDEIGHFSVEFVFRATYHHFLYHCLWHEA